MQQPLGDLKILFWDWAQRLRPGSELVSHPHEADVIVVDDAGDIRLVHREDVDIVVVGAEPVQPTPENVFFLRNHERIKWFLERVPLRSQIQT